MSINQLAISLVYSTLIYNYFNIFEMLKIKIQVYNLL